MNVTLQDTEIQICKLLGETRRMRNRQAGVHEPTYARKMTMEAEIDGVGAELAVAKAFNIYPDTTTHVRAGGHDLVSRKGATIDVKQTTHVNGRLMAPMTKRLEDADIYILVTGTMPKYKIVGWCHAEQLINKNTIGNLGWVNDVYMMPQKDLNLF